MSKKPKKIVERKYAALTATFLKGSLRGQIRSAYATRDTNLQKVADFKAAIACRDIPVRGIQLSPQTRAKAAELGLDLPPGTG
jgi:hypothetical protein